MDFTGKKLSIVDPYTGEIQDLEVFICVLGSSQYTYVEACEKILNFCLHLLTLLGFKVVY